MDKGFTVQAKQRQLFLDDEGIAELGNLKRSMHQPSKKGAVIRPDLLNGNCLQIRSAPSWDPIEHVYKILMFGDIGITYAESADGVQWTKPPIYQVSINGSMQNNCVTQGPGPFNIVYDPDEKDLSRRFKALAFNPDPKAPVGYKQPVVSPDCKIWRKLDVPLIPSQDESNLSFDAASHTFIATVKLSGPYGRSVFLSTSHDFENWSEPELIFCADETDQKLGVQNILQRFRDKTFKPPFYNVPDKYNVDVYNMGVFKYEKYYIGLPAMYHKTGSVTKDWEGFADFDIAPELLQNYLNDGDWGGFHHIQLTCSRDLKKWQRLGERKPFIDCSPTGAGAYDLDTVIGVSQPVYRENELWFYYSGLKCYGGPPIEKDAGAICLATLRRDGFISLDAENGEGFLVTDAFTCPEGDLHLNIYAAKGIASVSVHGEEGKEISGFEVSQPVSGNHDDAKVNWHENRFASLAGKRIRLRITLRKAQLYSWWVG